MKRRALAAALVALTVAAGYLHTIAYPFHYDDFSSIRDNLTLHHPEDLGAIWDFRPSRFVVHLSLVWNAALTGPGPAGLRAVNLLIHLAASLCVGWIAAEWLRQANASGSAGRAPRMPAPKGEARGRRIDRPTDDPDARTRAKVLLDPDQVGMIAALLFAAHPLATQAVTYLIQRTTSLAALLELLTVCFYLAARRSGRALHWIASCTAALLAALTKEMSVALPVVIVLVEISLRSAARSPRRAPGVPAPAPHPARLLPYLAVLPLVLWSATLPSRELGGAVTGWRETAEISRFTYLLTELTVIPRYLALWVLPAGQNLDPDVPLRHALDPYVAWNVAVIAALCIAAFRVRRRSPLAALGVSWFLITLLPESSLFPIRDVMVEHRAYLPMAGLSWAGASLLAGLATGTRVRLLVPAAIVIALVAATHFRNRVWRDEASLWSDVTRKSPRKPRGHNNFAMALEASGRGREAEAAYRRAIELDPGYVYARVNLGRLYGIAGRYPEAVRVLEEALGQTPDAVDVLTNLGNAWWGLGDTTRAVSLFERALVADPGARQAAIALARLRSGRR